MYNKKLSFDYVPTSAGLSTAERGADPRSCRYFSCVPHAWQQKFPVITQWRLCRVEAGQCCPSASQPRFPPVFSQNPRAPPRRMHSPMPKLIMKTGLSFLKRPWLWRNRRSTSGMPPAGGWPLKDRQDQADAKADSADNRQELSQQFRSYVHRNGITFPSRNAAGTEESSQTGAISESRQSEKGDKKINKKISSIERQLKDLTSQPEQVLASDIPDVAKEEQASANKKKMDELRGQLQALKAENQARQGAKRTPPETDV